MTFMLGKLFCSKVIEYLARYEKLKLNSKSQYERQFKAWGFKKNLTSTDWGDIAHRIGKRKRQGKESMIRFNDAIIASKKVKKEISRQVKPELEALRSQCMLVFPAKISSSR